MASPSTPIYLFLVAFIATTFPVTIRSADPTSELPSDLLNLRSQSLNGLIRLNDHLLRSVVSLPSPRPSLLKYVKSCYAENPPHVSIVSGYDAYLNSQKRPVISHRAESCSLLLFTTITREFITPHCRTEIVLFPGHSPDRCSLLLFTTITREFITPHCRKIELYVNCLLFSIFS